MVVSPSGRVTRESELAPSNAREPISFVPAGTSNSEPGLAGG